MGDELADNRMDHNASGREWRTPPLWGIGLAASLGLPACYLHDCRAQSLEEPFSGMKEKVSLAGRYTLR